MLRKTIEGEVRAVTTYMGMVLGTLPPSFGRTRLRFRLRVELDSRVGGSRWIGKALRWQCMVYWGG